MEVSELIYVAAKAIVAHMEQGKQVRPAPLPSGPAKPTATSNGIPVCAIHDKVLSVSGHCKDPNKDFYYCATKDENSGKWCRSKAGKQP